MPDTQLDSNRETLERGLREIVPPVLMTLGALSLLRSSKFLSVSILGTWLYCLAAASDDSRKRRGLDRRSRRAAEQQVDEAMEESFPASDPPSFSGATAGAP